MENQRLKAGGHHTNGGVEVRVFIQIARVLSNDLAEGSLLPIRYYTEAISAPTYYLSYQGTQWPYTCSAILSKTVLNFKLMMSKNQNSP